MAYKTLGKIRHNGKDYKIGEDISGLKKEEAKRLIDLKVLEEVSGKEGKEVKPDSAE